RFCDQRVICSRTMRRLLLSLAACVLLAACTAEPPTADPVAPLPDARPYEEPLDSPPDSSSGLEAPDEYGNEEPSATVAGQRRSIYDAPRAKVKCPMPAVGEGDEASMRRYMENLSACLDRLWERELREVNLHFIPPE